MLNRVYEMIAEISSFTSFDNRSSVVSLPGRYNTCPVEDLSFEGTHHLVLPKSNDVCCRKSQFIAMSFYFVLVDLPSNFPLNCVHLILLNEM